MINEDSDSEEEILVYAEFEDSVHIDKYRAIHILGVDEKNPIIQLDETFFMGKYEHALGTYMFFEQDHAIQGKDPLFDKYPDRGVKYAYKTRKLVSMEHAYVAPKEGKEPTSQSKLKQNEEDVQPVAFRELQEAIDSFKTYFVTEPTASTSDQNTTYHEKVITSESIIPSTVEIQLSSVSNTDNIRTETIHEPFQNNIEVEFITDQYPGDIEMLPINEQNTLEIATESTDS